MDRRFGLAMTATLTLAGSAAADVERSSYQLRGTQATASWHAWDGCIETSTSLVLVEQVSQSTGAPEDTSIAFVSLVRADWCNLAFQNAFAQVQGELDLGGTTSAEIDAEVTLDYESCGPTEDGGYACETGTSEPTALVASFVGTGEVISGRRTSMFRVGPFTSHTRMRGSSREASVTGSLTFDGAELFAGDVIAQLATASEGRLTLIHQAE